MASLNKVFLLGNLTRDPDLRGLPSGQSVCELRLAVSRRFQNSSGQDVEDTCFVDVVVWGRTASNCKQFLSKGSQVMVEGRLQLDQYRPQKCNTRKSMAPLFVYFILKQRSSEERPLRQQEILDMLEKRPYEIHLERKALSRILHNLSDMGDIFCLQKDAGGVWMW